MGKALAKSNPSRLAKLFENLRPTCLEAIRGSCFGKMYEVKSFRFNGCLISSLLDRFVEPNCFRLGEWEVGLEPIDVCVILGLRVVEHLENPMTLRISGNDSIHQRIFRGEKKIYVYHIESALESNPSDDDYVKLKLLLVIAAFLLSTGSETVDLRYVALVDDLDSFNQFPWGKVVYENLLVELRAARKNNEKLLFNIYGCAVLLQLWAYEHIPLLAPPPKPDHPFPRILRWEHSSSNKPKGYFDSKLNGLEQVILRLQITVAEMEEPIVREAINVGGALVELCPPAPTVDPAKEEMMDQFRRKYKKIKRRMKELMAENDKLKEERNKLVERLDAVERANKKRQKMHPAMHAGYVGAGRLATEKLKCSQKFLSLHKSYQYGSCSRSSTLPDSDLDTYQSKQVAGLGYHPRKRSLKTLGSLTKQTVVNPFCKNQRRKRVPVGPFFQAEVPTWTGVASKTSYHNSCDSDSKKWLESQIWPPKPNEQDSLVEIGPIGKGRPHSCGCELPGSVECIRSHVADKRLRLKLELGSAFYSWRFNHMGEEVSLLWTEEEEQMFKAIVNLNPQSLDRSFWDQAYKCFPYKSKQTLVSYYFNVFLLRRRSYQM